MPVRLTRSRVRCHAAAAWATRCHAAMRPPLDDCSEQEHGLRHSELWISQGQPESRPCHGTQDRLGPGNATARKTSKSKDARWQELKSSLESHRDSAALAGFESEEEEQAAASGSEEPDTELEEGGGEVEEGVQWGGREERPCRREGQVP
eukprot:988840-Rhodomonas_salina.1